MIKFHEYLAWRDKISLEEAARRSLARTWELAQAGKVMALITAFVKELPYEHNATRNSALMSDIRKTKFGYSPLYGYWVYEDPTTGQKEQIKEDSLLVSASVSIPNNKFKEIVLAWIQKYQQESAVIKYADADIAYWLFANGTEKQLGKWSINQLADYYSKMKYGAANRTFVFEASDNHSWSAQLAIQAMKKEVDEKQSFPLA